MNMLSADACMDLDAPASEPQDEPIEGSTEPKEYVLANPNHVPMLVESIGAVMVYAPLGRENLVEIVEMARAQDRLMTFQIWGKNDELVDGTFRAAEIAWIGPLTKGAPVPSSQPSQIIGVGNGPHLPS